MSASATSARPADTSVSATSEAHVSSVAAANMPSPKIRASITFGISGWAKPVTSRSRSTGAGAAAVVVKPMIAHCRNPAGGFVALRSSFEGIYAPVYRRRLVPRTSLSTRRSFDTPRSRKIHSPHHHAEPPRLCAERTYARAQRQQEQVRLARKHLRQERRQGARARLPLGYLRWRPRRAPLYALRHGRLRLSLPARLSR